MQNDLSLLYKESSNYNINYVEQQKLSVETLKENGIHLDCFK